MAEFKTIPLAEIHPDKNQPRKFFDDHAIKELTESVKSKGVLQPILVRPNGKGFILVCGERRYKASTAAGLKDIPAVIRQLDDQEALEIQFIENIQREDVHAMDEASTFKSMLENKVKPYTITDIAAKINKPEGYVQNRLSLNNLIPELQKDFWNGKFLIGHAALFSKLAKEDQKEVYKNAFDWDKNIKSIQVVTTWINTNIVHKLSAAPFKKDDPTLNPDMGACTTCPFRSGNNPSLFADIVKEDDRCLKPSCFKVKMKNFAIRTVKDVIENKAEILLISGYGNSPILPEIQTLIKENNVVVVKDHQYNTWQSSSSKKAKGIYVNGLDIGSIITIYLKNQKIETKDGKPVTSVEMDVAGIKQRTERAAELDDEKVWTRIHSEIINTKLDDKTGLDINMKLIPVRKLSNIDTAAAIYAMYEKAGTESSEVLKVFGIKESHLYGKEELAFTKKLLSATPEQFNKVTRLFIKGVLDSATGSHTKSGSLTMLKQVAEQYYPKEIAVIELEQKEKRDKREERSKQRIKALQDTKKNKPVKKVTPPAAREKQKKSIKKTGKKK